MIELKEEVRNERNTSRYPPGAFKWWSTGLCSYSDSLLPQEDEHYGRCF